MQAVWQKNGFTIGLWGFVFAGLMVNVGHAEPKPKRSHLPKCISVEPQAVQTAYGYDHVVAITSACKQYAQCKVSTNVAPKKHDVGVAPKKKVEVVTFRGSAASSFSVEASCVFAQPKPE